MSSPTVGNVSSATPIGSGTSISWNHTSNSNTLEITVGNADGSGGGLVTSITVNGVAATILGQVSNASYFAICQAVLTGVATSGTLAIVVTLATGGGAGVFASARSVIGVDQTTPTGTTATNFGTSDQVATATATSVSGDLVLGGINVYSTTNSTTDTSDWYAHGGALTLISGRGLEKTATGTSTTLTATGGGGGENKWVAIATAFKGASGGETGTGAITLGSITTAGTGTVTETGTGAISLGSITVAGVGERTVVVIGSPAHLNLSSITASGTGAVTTVETGTGAISLGSITVAGTGAIDKTGVGAIVLGSIAAVGSGEITETGSGSITLGSLTVSGIGTVKESGSGSITLGSVVVNGLGIVTPIGGGAILLKSIGVSGIGVVTEKATGAINLQSLTVAGSGIVTPSGEIVGSGNVMLSSMTVSGIGTDVKRFVSQGVPGPSDIAMREGAFASSNIRNQVHAGPDALTAGVGTLLSAPGGLIMGRFGWANNGQAFNKLSDAGDTPILGLVLPVGGTWQKWYWSFDPTFTTQTVRVLRSGLGVTLSTRGEFWVRFMDGAWPGQRVYASNADGRATVVSSDAQITPWWSIDRVNPGSLGRISTWSNFQ